MLPHINRHPRKSFILLICKGSPASFITLFTRECDSEEVHGLEALAVLSTLDFRIQTSSPWKTVFLYQDRRILYGPLK